MKGSARRLLVDPYISVTAFLVFRSARDLNDRSFGGETGLNTKSFLVETLGFPSRFREQIMSLAPATGLEVSATCLFWDAAWDEETSTHETRCRKGESTNYGKGSKRKTHQNRPLSSFPEARKAHEHVQCQPRLSFNAPRTTGGRRMSAGA